ncbi:MAG: hypothetical protein PSX81_01725 [bacterium]|nr:hypothetical protein [bacterium]
MSNYRFNYLQQAQPHSHSVPEQELSHVQATSHLSVPQQEPLQDDLLFAEYAYKAPVVATMAKVANTIIFFFILMLFYLLFVVPEWLQTFYLSIAILPINGKGEPCLLLNRT